MPAGVLGRNAGGGKVRRQGVFRIEEPPQPPFPLLFNAFHHVPAIFICWYLFRFFHGHCSSVGLCVWRWKTEYLQEVGTVCTSLFCNRANHYLSADLLSCTGRRILLHGTNQPCIFHCHIRDANLRTWLSVFRDQYFRCRPDDDIRKRILLRTDHISSLICTAAFISDRSSDKIRPDRHMAGCSRSRSNDPPCCCMVSETDSKVIAVDIPTDWESRYIGVANCTFFPSKTHFCLYCHNIVAKIRQNN